MKSTGLRIMPMLHASEPTFPIDIVIPWVDDTDIAWRTERQSFIKLDSGNMSLKSYDCGADRFRSWDNLQYIFRGIEKFMPWVRTVHIVTNGQIPSWLNLANPKINLVRHSDYIPADYLPTFNSHTIELNLHRISELAEHFIYFNDDTYVIREMKPSDFFSHTGLPKDQFGLWRVKAANYRSVMPHVAINNMGVINQNFSQRKVVKAHYKKMFSPKNGLVHLILSVLMYIISRKHFANILFHHMPAAFVKQTFRDVWAVEPEIMDKTSSHRYRDKGDVNQYLIRAWQMMNGKFVPSNISGFGEHFTYIRNDFSVVTNAIRSRKIGNRKLKMFCISDEKITDFPKAKKEINSALDKILPNSSSFELGTLSADTMGPNLTYGELNELIMQGARPQGL